MNRYLTDLAFVLAAGFGLAAGLIAACRYLA